MNLDAQVQKKLSPFRIKKDILFFSFSVLILVLEDGVEKSRPKGMHDVFLGEIYVLSFLFAY